MRQEPPLMIDPALGAATQATAEPVVLAGQTEQRFAQDHAPRRGMSMILTKAVFVTLGLVVGVAGVVACFGSIEGVMIGVPLILLGFGCAIASARSNQAFIALKADALSVYEGDTNDTNFVLTGEFREIDQMTRGEGRFAET